MRRVRSASAACVAMLATLLGVITLSGILAAAASAAQPLAARQAGVGQAVNGGAGLGSAVHLVRTAHPGCHRAASVPGGVEDRVRALAEKTPASAPDAAAAAHQPALGRAESAPATWAGQLRPRAPLERGPPATTTG